MLFDFGCEDVAPISWINVLFACFTLVEIRRYIYELGKCGVAQPNCVVVRVGTYLIWILFFSQNILLAPNWNDKYTPALVNKRNVS